MTTVQMVSKLAAKLELDEASVAQAALLLLKGYRSTPFIRNAILVAPGPLSDNDFQCCETGKGVRPFLPVAGGRFSHATPAPFQRVLSTLH